MNDTRPRLAPSAGKGNLPGGKHTHGHMRPRWGALPTGVAVLRRRTDYTVIDQQLEKLFKAGPSA